MNSVFKNKISYAMGMTLSLTVLVSPPINAVTIEMKEDFDNTDLNLETDYFNFETQVDMQQQAMDQVRHNYLLILELLQNKQFEEANAKITSLLQQNPNQPSNYNLKAFLQLETKNIMGAEQSFLKAIELDEKNNVALLGLSTLALDNREFDLSKQYANKALALNPYEAKAYQLLASAAMQQHGIDAAETLLLDAHDKVKNHFKEELIILQTLGKVYIIKKQPEKMLQLASDLVERKKENTSALSYLAEAQLVNQDKSGAENTLRLIIAQQPGDAKHLFLLAKLLDEQKQYNKALSSYQKAYDIAPDIQTLDAILKIYTEQKKPQDAVVLLEKRWGDNKDDPRIQYRLARAYQEAGQLDNSSKHYEALLARKKDNVIILNNLAWVYSQQNNPKARKLAQQAHLLAPKSGTLADTYGYILLKNGNIQESLKILKRAAELDPALTIIQLHLAEAYIANQKKSEAKTILQRLINEEAVEKDEARMMMENL